MTWYEVPSELLDAQTVQPVASKRGRKKRADLPSPGIRKDTLGVFPVSGLSVSALAAGTAEAMLGYAHDTLSIHLKDRRKIRVQSGRRSEELELKGKFYNGLADAFYRAQLPQVLIVSPPVEGLIPFVDEVLDYVEKLVSLGFFLRKKDPVQEYLPCFVLVSEGIVFNNVVSAMAQHLYNIVSLDEYQRRRIMDHFMRGVFRRDGAVSVGATETPAAGGVVMLTPVPTQIRLAGANQAVLEQARGILSRHGLVASVESRVPNAMERLEFEEAWWQICAHLPQLQAAQFIRKEEARDYQTRMAESILAIGQARRAFEEMEPLNDSPSSQAGITSGSVALYRMLRSYADALGRLEDMKLYEAMQAKITEYLRKESC